MLVHKRLPNEELPKGALRDWTPENQKTIEREVVRVILWTSVPLDARFGDLGYVKDSWPGGSDRLGIFLAGDPSGTFLILDLHGCVCRWQNAAWVSLRRATQPILDLLQEHELTSDHPALVAIPPA
jgi:hypothetical protein